MPASPDLEYVGFWLRFVAFLVDSVLAVIILAPLLTFLYGGGYWERTSFLPAGPLDLLLNYALPAVAVIAFWVARQATPGKMVIGARIVDARSGGNLSTGQCIIRYLGYYLSTLVLGLGFLWIAFDPRKQGWHDKLAGTVVVRKHAGAVVAFPDRPVG